MLKIAICDDNEAVLRQLSQFISEELKTEHTIQTFSDALLLCDYVEEVAKGAVDILFLDIVLQDKNGINLAKHISEHYPQIKIIFITGYLEYAQRIFEVEPVYFLVKPLQRTAVVAALQRACERLEQEEQNGLSLLTKNGIVTLRLSGIHYIASDNKVVRVVEGQKTWEARMKLDELASKLPANFLRCGQSFLVNMDRIRNFRTSEIELYDGTIIPVSRSKYKEARRKFLDYLGGTV